MENTNPINETLSFAEFLQMIPDNKEFLFRFLDLFPVPVEVFAPDGTTVFINKIGLELYNIPDSSLVVGKYNVLKDPVCNDQMGMRDSIQRAFRGEACVCLDVIAPVQDLVDRSVIAEKPFEKSFMDWYLYPINDNEKLVFVVFVCIAKKLYYGRPDLAKAREFIDTHWEKGFDPQAVAKSVNMSVAQLYNLFKKHTGMTPGDYYRKCKVTHLKETLADKNLSVKAAFTACGVDSRGAYAKIFKKLTGLSPAKFRAQ